METADLLIIGGGPAGLCAAINGASEGLRVRLLDNGAMLGGQARESRAIENYPGFPEGVTGNDLMTRFIEQAHKFETLFNCPWSAVGLLPATAILGGGNMIIAHTDTGQEIPARAVLLSTGLQYQMHPAKGVSRFMGRGVWYGLPNGTNWGKRVIVVGGANSAGQAALALAQRRDCEVTIVTRSPLTAKMSQYLVGRIERTPNIRIMERAQIEEVQGGNKVEGVVTNQGTLDTQAVFMFIGAKPRTFWLRNTLALDERGFVCTDIDTHVDGRLPFETSMPGVFAAGDVRSGSTKRITVACGEGATALQMVHRRLGA